MWPLLLSDLASVNFCLWGHLKVIAYLKRVTEQDELWCLIEVAVTVTQHMPGILHHTRNSSHQRAQFCVETNQDHLWMLEYCFVEI